MCVCASKLGTNRTERNKQTTSKMDETTALNDVTTTTTTTEKKGYTSLAMSLALLLGIGFYAGQIHGGTSLAGVGGTTRGATASYEFTGHFITMDQTGTGDLYTQALEPTLPKCVKSEGTFDSQKDYCYSCGGTSDSGKLGYCWNSQTPQCSPKCDNLQAVSGIGVCGGACDEFASHWDVNNEELCNGMGYVWYLGSCTGSI